MKYEIVELNDIKVVGRSIKTSNDSGKSIKDIGDMWESIISDGVFNQIKNKTNGKGIGLYTEYDGDYTNPYRFMCCTEVEDFKNDEMESLVIKSGKYAKFTIKGNMMVDVGKAWEKIWSMDIDRAYTYDFELYHNDSEDMNNQTIDIYIALN